MQTRSTRRRHQVFISYRQEDSAGSSGRVYDRLVRRFGPNRVFRDIATIPPGVEWDPFIESSLRSCGVVVAVIGRRWLTVKRGGMRRLDRSDDLLRRELEVALAEGIPVIPTLVDGAQLPRADQLPIELRPLLRLQAIWLHEQEFGHCLDKLIRRLEAVLPAERWRLVPAVFLAAGAAGTNMLLGAAPWVAAGISLAVVGCWLLFDRIL